MRADPGKNQKFDRCVLLFWKNRRGPRNIVYDEIKKINFFFYDAKLRIILNVKKFLQKISRGVTSAGIVSASYAILISRGFPRFYIVGASPPLTFAAFFFFYIYFRKWMSYWCPPRRASPLNTGWYVDVGLMHSLSLMAMTPK